ncbi:MAG TPA: anti-sigma factor [Spirillospora sp.]|nr:anti-sigma factor [Spirillospora sp.]
MDRQTFLDLIPAYALGALDAAEQAEFEARLANDAEAQKLLAEYQALTQALVLTASARPAPAHLGADLRRRVASSRSVSAPASDRRLPPPWRRWLATAAVLAVVFGVVWALNRMQSDVPAPACAEVQTLYEQAGSANIIRVSVAPNEQFADVYGELLADPNSNTAVIQVNNLPPLNDDQTFQLWLAEPDQTVSGGLFRPAGETTCITLPLQLPFEQYNGFGVSLEQAGGSPDPNRRTGPSVFGVRLNDA